MSTIPKKGDRIRLVHMRDDPDPVPLGTEGTVTLDPRPQTYGGKWTQVDVDWDNGRTLKLVIPPDIVEVL